MTSTYIIFTSHKFWPNYAILLYCCNKKIIRVKSSCLAISGQQSDHQNMAQPSRQSQNSHQCVRCGRPGREGELTVGCRNCPDRYWHYQCMANWIRTEGDAACDGCNRSKLAHKWIVRYNRLSFFWFCVTERRLWSLSICLVAVLALFAIRWVVADIKHKTQRSTTGTPFIVIGTDLLIVGFFLAVFHFLSNWLYDDYKSHPEFWPRVVLRNFDGRQLSMGKMYAVYYDHVNRRQYM